MRIRKCRSWRTANGPEWRHLDSLCFPGDVHFLNGKDYRWWGVRDDDGKLIGYAGLWLDGNTAHFTRCGVAQSSRGRGVQRALIAARIRWCRRSGIRTIKTYTAVPSPSDPISPAKSAANLSACGFRHRKSKDGKWVIFTLCIYRQTG